MTYKKDDSVKDALKNQNPLLWIRALFSKSSAEVTINVDYNEDALSKAIGSIQAVKAEQTEPVSAYPKFDGTILRFRRLQRSYTLSELPGSFRLVPA